MVTIEFKVKKIEKGAYKTALLRVWKYFIEKNTVNGLLKADYDICETITVDED